MFLLHSEAVEQRIAAPGEGGTLEFFAKVKRARQGDSPGALLKWLLVNKRSDFVTQAHEDRALARLKAYRDRDDDPRRRSEDRSRKDTAAALRLRDVGPFLESLTPELRIVHGCLQASQKYRIHPKHVAQRVKGWSADRWELAHASYQVAERRRWIGERAPDFEKPFSQAFTQLTDG